MSFPKVACFQSSIRSRRSNKAKFTMSNTYVDICFLGHFMYTLKPTALFYI